MFSGFAVLANRPSQTLINPVDYEDFLHFAETLIKSVVYGQFWVPSLKQRVAENPYKNLSFFDIGESRISKTL